MVTYASLLALQASGNGASTAFSIVCLVIVVLDIWAMWHLFAKAGQPGWAILVPIYNAIVLIQVAGKPAWWFFLFFVPLVNIWAAFVVAIGFAKNFGKSAAWGVGLVFLGFILYPVMAFQDLDYLPVA